MPPMGRSCKRRDCPRYVSVWMGDQGVRLLENLLSYDGYTAMLTLTAPGADLLPWDEDHCEHLGPHRHSGPLGCRVRASQLRAFNEQSIRAWSALWDVVRKRVDRAVGQGACRLLAYVVEPQKRGAIHLHLVFGAGTARDREALDMVWELVQLIAPGYGWGRVHADAMTDGQRRERGIAVPDQRTRSGIALWHSARAASYVSKYLTDEKRGAGTRDLLLSGHCPRRPIYVSSTLSRGTRCTMRNLRSRRYLYCLGFGQVPLAHVEAVLARIDLAAHQRQVRQMIDVHETGWWPGDGRPYTACVRPRVAVQPETLMAAYARLRAARLPAQLPGM